MDNEPGKTSGGLDLRHEALTAPPLHIPDGKGGAFKTQLTIERTALTTRKILWWHDDDPREIPHNHPWDFESTILHGGYTEERFWFDGDELKSTQQSFTEGDVNRISTSEYHNVRNVLPGTVTSLVCGPASSGNEWHYLDTETLEKVSSDDPEYLGWMRAINPHLRDSKWS